MRSACWIPIFWSSSEKKKITGKEYIPQEVLVDVLVDIHLTDGVTEDRKYYRKYNFNDSIDLMSPIFRKYEITREMFDSTMVEYSRHPELLDKVYDEVIMKLNLMLDEIDERSESSSEDPEDDIESPATDSIKNQVIPEESRRRSRRSRQ